jgi:hypothetical protein
MQAIPSTRQPLISITDLELLHVGLGALIAHYSISDERCVARCIALGISRQLRLIAEHPALPDPALRPLYLTMAARWQLRAADEAFTRRKSN